MKVSVLIARRLLKAKRVQSRGTGVIAVLGVASGVMALIVVLGVMNGLQMGTIESILELDSYHIRIETGISASTWTHNTDRYTGGIETLNAVVPMVELQTLARGFWKQTRGIYIRAVPEDWLQYDKKAAMLMKPVGKDFSFSGGIVLGYTLAQNLGVRLGDTVYISHLPGSGIVEESLTVTGIFRTNNQDINKAWAYVSLQTAVEVLKTTDQVVIGVKLEDRFQDIPVVEYLHGNAPHNAHIISWREYNRGIFGALRMEKAITLFLLALIFVVIAGNIYQLLRRSIYERSDDITMLRVLGASVVKLRFIFMLEGWFIGVLGSIIGTSAGLFIVYNIRNIFLLLERLIIMLNTLNLINMSTAYFYLFDVPARVMVFELYTIVCISLTVCIITAGMAARAVTGTSVLRLLRGE